MDWVVGLALIGVGVGAWAYYTAWVFVVPSLGADHALAAFFLPHDPWALTLPLLLLLVGVAAIGAFIALTIAKSKREKARKAAAKAAAAKKD